MSVLFDAMGAMSSKYNDTPTTASRPYDESRDGFVISGGAKWIQPAVVLNFNHRKLLG
jgi:3-oxoacyl-(acyl-carrier-protein) synthase